MTKKMLNEGMNGYLLDITGTKIIKRISSTLLGYRYLWSFRLQSVADSSVVLCVRVNVQKEIDVSRLSGKSRRNTAIIRQ